MKEDQFEKEETTIIYIGDKPMKVAMPVSEILQAIKRKDKYITVIAQEEMDGIGLGGYLRETVTIKVSAISIMQHGDGQVKSYE